MLYSACTVHPLGVGVTAQPPVVFPGLAPSVLVAVMTSVPVPGPLET